MTLAGRYDDYSGTGNTFNPKIGLRYQPTQATAVSRLGQYGLPCADAVRDQPAASLTFTTDNYDDPLLCPGATRFPAPRPASSAASRCCAEASVRFANRPAASTLEPEKSKAFNVRLVFEPTNNVTLGFDSGRSRFET